MITSATSRRSSRAADGLRRPSESRAFLASRSTIYLDDACRFEPRPLDLREGEETSMMRGHIGDTKYTKASALISGNRGLGLSASCRHVHAKPPAASGGRRKAKLCLLSCRLSTHDVWRPDEPTTDFCEKEISPMQRRTKDLKASAPTVGIRGLGPYFSRRRRWIPSISSCTRNNFGQESVVFS
ncbi:hypothetical protein THAOC_34456 [Thalassiosira oceanica]|uniref:Uncharacterized protein n=1 Tax=Thalassiosira oceanica TaxID=159749 RepID=K0RCQ1_THAOC|nr:hypothetical protein THAOC_34456 [Thalassiosira oceanica]|eukprot:EJK46856.1 hypothetical protein THAOC_34456 [Thalassiosira oceanica]